jgi:hypothetical protein
LSERIQLTPRPEFRRPTKAGPVQACNPPPKMPRFCRTPRLKV